jgi:MFS family permease
MSAPPKLFNRGFVSLLVTQFFGAVNDNVLKQVLMFGVAAGGIWTGQLGDGAQGWVSLCLTVPFIILSGFAGQIADRTSKARVTVVVKIAEIALAAVAFFGFFTGNLTLTLTALVLLAVQSTFFGPAKYGMIPELVGDDNLSQANGSINMFTNIAVIAGTLLAGPVYDRYAPSADPVSPATALPWLPGVILVSIAVLGLVACLFLPKLKPMDPSLKIRWNPFGLYVTAIRDMAKTHLLNVALAWAFFYLIGMMALLILPDYKELLNISASKASVLLGVLGLSIGLGSVSAGLISGKHIKPKLIPVGAIGMTSFFLLLGIVPPAFGSVATLLLGAGIFAGLYIVPLQSLLQHLSPDDERGRFLGTANAMSFVASTAGSLVFIFAKSTLDLPSNRVFLIVSALALIGIGLLLVAMRKALKNPDAP